MDKNFCVCCDDNYAPFACITIQSIIDNMSEKDNVRIHIISDGISRDMERIFLGMHANIEIHIVNADDFKNVLPSNSEWSIATWYRILLPEILPDVDKVLYLDCDVIVNGCLDDLFGMDMEEALVAGAVDTQNYNDEVFNRLNLDKSGVYICAGVLLMNLKLWREEKTSEKIISYARENKEKLHFFDQDCINKVCSSKKIALHPKYGVLVSYFRNHEFMSENPDIVIELFEHPVIVHYAGYQPWIYAKNKSPHAGLWWSVFNRYGDYDIFKRIKINYRKTMVKWIARILLSRLHIISKQSKFHIDQYYNHPRISKKIVESELKKIKNEGIRNASFQ